MPAIDLHYEVSEDEATKLMIYHLRIAAAYFECTADDERNGEAIDRELSSPAKDSAAAFVAVLETYYKMLGV